MPDEVVSMGVAKAGALEAEPLLSTCTCHAGGIQMACDGVADSERSRAIRKLSAKLGYTKHAASSDRKVDPRSGEIVKGDITMSSGLAPSCERLSDSEGSRAGWVKAWLEDIDTLAPEPTEHRRRARLCNPR